MSKMILIFKICATVFSVEILMRQLVGGLLDGLQLAWPLPVLPSAFIDAFLLTSLSAPIIYLWAVRPFVLSQRRAKAELSRGIRRFEDAQRVGSLGSWEYIEDKETLLLSDPALHLLDLRLHMPQIFFKHYCGRVHEEDREMLTQTHQALLTSGTPYNIVYRLPMRDGSWKWIREYGSSDYDHVENRQKFLGTMQDITPMREAEIAKSKFFAQVSHELRTPITSIRGALGMIDAGVTGKLPEQAARLVSVAYSNSERLLSLVNDILDHRKLASGKMEFRMEIIDLATLVRDTIVANEGYAQEFGVRYHLSIHERPALIKGDRDRFIQVMNNLLSNAAKFSPQGDQVEVSLNCENDDIIVSVLDHGPGISKEDQEIIFEDFAQSKSSGSNIKAGTGLGLGIARQIVEQHGGRIELESDLGAGAKFKVRLKRVDVVDQRQAA